MTTVFKFGGASIKDADAIRHLTPLIEKHTDRPLVVVVSAMGKTTNKLEALLAAARSEGKEEAYRECFEALQADHHEAMEVLFGDSRDSPAERVDALFDELDALHRKHRASPYARHYDQTVCYGELISTTIVAAWLNHCGIATDWHDARELVRTDACHQAANLDWAATADAIRGRLRGSERVILTQGFIGGTEQGEATTLGREGSDFSAAIFAHCLDAREVVIWKDVTGLFNADPRRFDNAIQLERLSYAEATELAWHGAKVIHPKTLGPLQEKSIPLTVRSFETPDAAPSVIDAERRFDAEAPCCILREEQVWVEVLPRDFAFMDEPRQHDILGRLVEAGLHANLVDSSAMRFALCLDDKPERLEQLIDSLEADYEINREDGLTLLTVRHPRPGMMDILSEGREALAERRNATTAQRLFRSSDCPETWHIPESR
ncbi:aspartate kinase [Halomonas sp. MCCC 1A17488]|uniref:Aspartokinase n=1 Tax=Billgrantia sulfidoxydans TaxID=2733484 RepID=A0ABX7W8S1_9GAMM|nr:MULTISPECIES: aspartate kinase [Halomonas]MCE8017456.1 aspartate kinase [Halomonas sp. MCCC 1A17488]MCG3240789.1 aspartate kinase [Halomonas sp. MCCC 1A17488]QPP49375.1 aspartate kinase [Halomonas sp. SS10-MC5]QTP56734.1 aspartate kinase [Halomonas sulfidoxydans]